MFVETPEARLIRPTIARKDRFVVEFADWNVWTIIDTEGHWQRRAFGLYEDANTHKRGLEAYVRGDHATAVTLLDIAAKSQDRRNRGIYG